jgi:hypothetical protein
VITRSPESAIRLSAICGSDGMLCLDSSHGQKSGEPAVMIKLIPMDLAPASLPTASHSRRGELAWWLRVPPLPISLLVSQLIKSSIQKYLCGRLNDSIGSTR